MKRQDTIERASQFAYADDSDYYVGLINGEWELAHSEDLGRQAQMIEGSKTRVTSEGEQAD